MKYLLASEIVDAVVGPVALYKCPDCEFDYPAEAFIQCFDCEHVSCRGCMEFHAAEPHISDSDNSPEAHGAWRKYDA